MRAAGEGGMKGRGTGGWRRAVGTERKEDLVAGRNKVGCEVVMG